jgi:hypothetical protein
LIFHSKILKKTIEFFNIFLILKIQVFTVLYQLTKNYVHGYSILMIFRFIERPTLLVACLVDVKV